MNKKIGNIFKGDKVVWMIFFFLCMVSIVEVFSASSGLTYKSQNYIGPSHHHFEYPLPLFQTHDALPDAYLSCHPTMGIAGRYQGG